MKKLLLISLCAVALMVANSANAQSDNTFPKNEFSVSYGVASNSQWIDFYSDVISTALGVTTKDKFSFGPISAEYFRRLSPVIAVGAVGVITSEKRDLLYKDEKYADYTSSYYTLMPAVKFNWLRKEKVGLYSKLAAGVTFTSNNIKDADKTVSSDKDKDLMFNFQASMIGVEVGTTIRGFAEIGVGEQGLILLGLRYRF